MQFYCICNRYCMQRIHVGNRPLCAIGLSLQLIGALVSSDWQSVGGDPCISVGQLDTILKLDSMTVFANDTTYVTIDEGIYGSLLSVRENLTFYGDATPFSGSRTILCSPIEVTNGSMYIDCYWLWQEVSMMVVLEESSIDINDHSSNYLLAFNLSHESIDTLELFCSEEFSFEKNHSSCNWQNALLSNIKISQCYDNFSLDSQCLCESFDSRPDYKCFWNPNSRITGDYCERCPHTCLSISHSLSLVQLALGLLLGGFGFGLSRFTYTLIVSDCFGDKSQVRRTLTIKFKPSLFQIYTRGFIHSLLIMNMYSSVEHHNGNTHRFSCNF